MGMDASKDSTKEAGDLEPGSRREPAAGPAPAERIMEQIDLEMLAERVFDRLMAETRVERERAGWSA